MESNAMEETPATHLVSETESISTQQHPHVANNGSPELHEIVEEPSLDPYFEKLERFELFSTNQCYYLVGGNKANTVFRVLKMDRTLIDRPQMQPTVHPPLDPNGTSNTSDAETASADNSHLPKPTLRPLSDFLSEDSQTYSQEEIRDMLDMIDDGNRMSNGDRRPGEDAGNSGGLKPLVKAYGIVGFVRFLDCYYLTLITRRAKVGSIGGNNIYTIKVRGWSIISCVIRSFPVYLSIQIPEYRNNSSEAGREKPNPP